MTAERWNAFWEWPLMTAALAFLGLYAWQVIGDLHGPASQAVGVLLTITWVMFTINYVGRLYLADRRWSWFVRHPLDLAIVVLPMLRPLRLVRLVILLAVFQRVTGRTMHGRVAVYVAGSTVMLVFVASLAELSAERHEPGASINSFGNALWWACSTITTVGYGDMAPISLEGRCIAVALMVGGIALLGTITATLASWIVRRVAEEDEAGQSATRRQVEALAQQLAALQHDVEIAAHPSTPPRPEPARRRTGPRHPHRLSVGGRPSRRP